MVSHFNDINEDDNDIGYTADDGEICAWKCLWVFYHNGTAPYPSRTQVTLAESMYRSTDTVPNLSMYQSISSILQLD